MPPPVEAGPESAGASPTIRRVPTPSIVAAGIAILIGCVVLIGWAFDLETCKRVLPGLVAMSPTTALCFISAGSSLIVWTRPGRPCTLARMLAAVPLAVGTLKLVSLTTGMDIPLDHLLFAAKLADAQTGFPNRMAPNTALNFLLIGGALLLIDVRTQRGIIPAQSLTLLAALASLLAVFGYAYGAKPFYGVGSYIPMALHTALTFVVMVLGILAWDPQRGVMATFAHDGAGGVMARRLLPAVIGLPFLIGWLRIKGEAAGYYDAPLGLAISVVASTAIIAALIWWTATRLRGVDELRLQAEAGRNAAARQLEAAHEEVQRKNAQMEADLMLAREIQQAFLPQQFISFPQPGAPVAGALRFYHRYRPTTALGGDFADVLLVSDHQAGILVCDVMGHGVRSALVTAVVRGLAEELMSVASDPGEFLTQLNRGLLKVLQRTKTPMFMTALYLVADVERHEVRYASAGHPSPMRLRKHANNHHADTVEIMGFPDAEPGPALGVFKEAGYATCQSPLQAGDLLLLFTDGLVEIENEAGEEFDEARLLASIRARAMYPPEQILDDVIAEALRFSGQAEFEDDICLMGMEVTKSYI